MKCSSCNTENRTGAQFCEHCGASLIEVIYCQSCNSANRVAAKYCDSCGAPFSPAVSSSYIKRFCPFNVRPVLYGAGALICIWLALNAYTFFKRNSDLIPPVSNLQNLKSQGQPEVIQGVPEPSRESVENTASGTLIVPGDETNFSDRSDSFIAEVEPNAEAERAAAEAMAKANVEKAAEEAAMLRSAASQDAINTAIKAIRLKVNRSWIRPASAVYGAKCRIRVRLLSDGSVIEAKTIASSGDELFDRSAESAVRNASPLPVPTDIELFAKTFRSFTFTFDPVRGSE